MKLIVEIEVTEQEAWEIGTCSLERVINNGATVCGAVAANGKKYSEEAGVYLDDVDRMKPVASRLWDAARNAIFVATSEEVAK